MLFVNLCLQHLISKINCSMIQPEVEEIYTKIITDCYTNKNDPIFACSLLSIKASNLNADAIYVMEWLIRKVYHLMDVNKMKPETKEKTLAQIKDLAKEFLKGFTQNSDCKSEIDKLIDGFEESMKLIIESIRKEIIYYSICDEIISTTSIGDLDCEVLGIGGDVVKKIQREVNRQSVLLWENRDKIEDQQAFKKSILSAAKKALTSLIDDYEAANRDKVLKSFEFSMLQISYEMDNAILEEAKLAIKETCRKI